MKSFTPLCIIKALNGLSKHLNWERNREENGPVVQLTGMGERTDRNKRKRGEVRGVMDGEKIR